MIKRENENSLGKSINQLFFELIRASIGVSKLSAIPSAHEWEQLYDMARKQSLVCICFSGLQQLCENHSELTANMPMPLKMQWIGQVMAYEKIYARHEKVMAELALLYSKEGLRMMVLKGYGLSLDWPVPNHRMMGDLDIYHYGQWREADSFLRKHCNVKVDDGHEHHTVFSFYGVMVENHYDFINTKAHRDAPRIEARLKQLALENGKKIEVQGSTIYLPSADFNAIFLMRHMGQHFAGEHLNLRQVFDWGFFMRAHSQEVNWNATIHFLKEIGLYQFFNQINAICTDCLGFAEDVFPEIERNPSLEQRILRDILYPEFEEDKPLKSLLPILRFKTKRWWSNRWKHQLVYNDSLQMTFLTLAWSHMKRFRTIKD